MKNFEDFKKEILARAKKVNACESQYERAYKAKGFSELFAVIKDNFNYCCENHIITAELIELVKIVAAENDVFVNTSTSKGLLLACGNATVRACGNATVRACGNATVEACGNATVEAWGNATVRAWGNATVEAWGNATVRAWGNATVEAWGNATVRAWDNATVEAWGNATVRACGNAYINVVSTMECEISEKAIMRHRDTDTIFVCSSLKVITL